jgi:tRNA(Ile)-lysidine synthase
VSTSWLARIPGVLKRWRDSGLGETWVVAVSGGSDSVGLLRVLHATAPELGVRLSVAHLDHGVRGESARADAEFVAGLADGLGLPIDLGSWRPSRPGHFEADARRARYAWLAEVARARGASGVAVGHTKDDQAETILHRIVRGTGLHGLAGMPGRRPLSASATLFRPLLHATRGEIREYLAAIGQPFRDDASNDDQSRTRARIRHDLLPRLAADYNPEVADALVRLGGLAGASGHVLRRRVREVERAALLRSDEDSFALDRRVLSRSSHFLRAEVLRMAWRRAGWPEGAMGMEQWRRLARLAGSSRARVALGNGVEVVTDFRELIVTRSPPLPDLPPRRPVPLPLPGEAPWDGGRVVATLDPGPDAPRDETIDLDRLVPPLLVRAPRPGDRFTPLGMGGSQALNDFFRGRRVSPAQRRGTPLVCDRLGIVWVVGHRIAQRVRRTDATRREVGLRWEREETG